MYLGQGLELPFLEGGVVLLTHLGVELSAPVACGRCTNAPTSLMHGKPPNPLFRISYEGTQQKYGAILYEGTQQKNGAILPAAPLRMTGGMSSLLSRTTLPCVMNKNKSMGKR